MAYEMEDDDYKIAMTGPLYSKYSVSNHKFLTEVDELDEALQFVRDHMEQEQYWPNVWHINDHGNVDLMNVQTGEFIDNSTLQKRDKR